MDQALLDEKPAGWQVVGRRKRTIVTRFGEMTVERRLYRDEKQEERFLLDEALGLEPRQVATPEVKEAVVALAADVSFEKAAAHLRSLTGGVLSKSTVWRLLRRVGRAAQKAEEAVGRAVYERGYIPPPGEHRTRVLYVEADGVWVRLQREEQEGMEIKVGIAYEGWERLRAKDREQYRLRNKRVYVHCVPGLSFWEGAMLAWWRF